MISQHSRPGERRDPYSAASRSWAVEVDTFSNNQRRWLWVPAFAGTTRGKSTVSNLAGDVLLHPVGHLDQPPPSLLEERHHAIHVAVARQRNFDLAFALGHLRLGLFQRVGLRQ